MTQAFSWQSGKTAATKYLTRPFISHSLRRLATRGGAISVLCYHSLGPDEDDFDAWTVVQVSKFRQHIEMLRAYYDIVSIDHALSSVGTRAPKPKAVVTFDDGEHGLHRYLLPIVDELQLPVTIYIATGQIESQEPYWFDVIINALQTKQPVRIDLSSFGLAPITIGDSRGPENWIRISHILEHLKTLSPDTCAAAACEAVRQVPPASRPNFTPLSPLTVAELCELARHPLVKIGSHTHCHSLPNQVALHEAEASIRNSVKLLDDWGVRDTRHFAYPNGYSTASLARAVAAMDFRSAVILGGQLWRTGDSPYLIPRIAVGRYHTAERLQLLLIAI